MVSKKVKDIFELWNESGEWFDGVHIANELMDYDPMGSGPHPKHRSAQWRSQYALIEREGNTLLNQHFGEECFFPNLANEKDPNGKVYPPDPDRIAAFKIIADLQKEGFTVQELLESILNYRRPCAALIMMKNIRRRLLA